ncbi:hypothetical protein HYDPIDRAFT_25558 [Hydnomerulius pinastri MD-312]|nr:hypothetical protein HYDPIDRAFT_25558 [Hydnomerulius pinastri MD-312]
MHITETPAIGQRIMDPRILSDEVGNSDYSQPNTPNLDLPMASTSRVDSRNSPRSGLQDSYTPSGHSHLNSPSSVPAIHLTRPGTSSSMASSSTAGSPTVSVQTVNTLSSSSSSSATSSRHSDNLYSNLATFTFGEARVSPHASSNPSYDAVAEANESISPLTPMNRRSSIDRTPRPSVSGHSASPPLRNDCSHPSQGAGRPASTPSASSSQSRHQSPTSESFRNPTTSSSGSRSRAASRTEREESEDPTSNTDHMIGALYHSTSHRGRVVSDNASQHTFGHGARRHGVGATADPAFATASSSSVSVTSSRSSSRASMRTNEQFSSDDEVEIGYFDGGSSPVTFARDYLVDIDEDVDLAVPDPSFHRTNMFDGRRGSLPMAIPGAVPSGDASSVRSREGSILTLRRPSQSWDEASSHITSQSGDNPAVIVPRSEPLSRTDWISLEAQVQAQQQQAAESGNVYDGLDLRYILSRQSEGSIRSFHSSAQLSFIHGPPGQRSSAEASSSRLSSIAPFAFGPRRTSTVTLQSNDDPFYKHIRKYDQAFDAIEDHWSFMREKADGAGVSSSASSSTRHGRSSTSHSHIPNTDKAKKTMPPGTQEIWRCGHVGRFKVDRLAFKQLIDALVSALPTPAPIAQSADPAKAAQHRINIRHIPDPYLKGNTTSGPHSVIHKHSRAIAFSIFRSHSLFSSRRGGAGSTHAGSQGTHMNTRYGIMLAPKKVQEQYTSTKTTRQLSTHGLLDEDSRGSKDKGRGGRRGTQSLSFRERDSREKEKRKAQEKEEAKAKAKAAKAASKGKGKDRKDKKHRPDHVNPTESTESSTATSSAGSVSNGAMQQIVSAPARSTTSKIRFSPPSISSSTTVGQRELMVSRPSSPTESLPPSISDSVKVPESDNASMPPTRHHRDHRDSIDSDDRLPTRTPHAEAFSAMDPSAIEHFRSKSNNRTTDSGATLTERFLRVFRGNSRPDGSSSGSLSAQPSSYTPPWLVTATREAQEQNDRVINDLNNSFRDVGLLHTQPHKSTSKSTSKRKPQEIFDRIPDDSLYMLLPLWAGETETPNTQAQGSDTASLVTVPDNRQYLLVYYIPFEELKGKQPEQPKKKAKQSHSSSDGGGDTDQRTIFLPAFRVIARVVTYDELRNTGIRVPSDGLAITGPAWEAMSYTISPTLRQDLQTHDTVICICHGRDRGFLFLADALSKLGLCTAEELPMHVSTEEEEREGEILLTAIGRAAVEMIWLGCLAITSFGPV